MALQTDKNTSEVERNNNSVVVHIYDIELNNGVILYLTDNNADVTWSNNLYKAFPIKRPNTSQQGSQRVGDLTITLGDGNNNLLNLSKEILNNLSLVRNAFVTINQQQVDMDTGVGSGFRQIFRGRIKSVSGSIGIINFNIVAPYSDPQRPTNNKKFGEFKGMIDAFRELF